MILIKSLYDFVDECLPGWTSFHGSCYLHGIEPTGHTWLQAEDHCVEMGGHLVSIQNTDELQFIHYMLTTKWKSNEKDVFIGMCS